MKDKLFWSVSYVLCGFRQGGYQDDAHGWRRKDFAHHGSLGQRIREGQDAPSEAGARDLPPPAGLPAQVHLPSPTWFLQH